MLYAQVDDRCGGIQAECAWAATPWYRRLKSLTCRSRYGRGRVGAAVRLSPAPQARATVSVNWTAEAWMDILAQARTSWKLDAAARNWTQRLLQTYLAVYHQITLRNRPIQLPASGRHSLATGQAARAFARPVVRGQAPAHAELQRWPWPAVTSAASAHPRSESLLKRLVWPSGRTDRMVSRPRRGLRAHRPAGKVDSPGLANPWHALFGSLVYPSGEGCPSTSATNR